MLPGMLGIGDVSHCHMSTRIGCIMLVPHLYIKLTGVEAVEVLSQHKPALLGDRFLPGITQLSCSRLLVPACPIISSSRCQEPCNSTC